jgi:hypothetical protein
MTLPLRLLVVAALATSSAAAAPSPTLHFRAFAHTGIRLTGVVWTGKRFLYVENTTNAIFAGGAKGGPLRPFAKLPKLVEETRCVVSPGGHGFSAGEIYCHIPDNRIFRISADGTAVRLFASLPTRRTSDGMLAIDTVGRFGYRLVAATGRSGNPTPSGGVVFTIDSAGHVRRVGAYPGPGGADEVAIAPPSFGPQAGWALLTVDPGPTGGAVVALSPLGRMRTIAHLPDGPNPMAVIRRPGAVRGPAAPGLYVADTNTRNVYLASAEELARYAGSVIVGSELQARFWIITARGPRFVTRELKTDLPPAKYNLEGADYVR